MQRTETLSRKLTEFYNAAAAEGKRSIAALLFGIAYADQINDCGSAPATLAEMAGIGRAYGTDISKGIRMSPYVELKAGSALPK